MKTIWAPWRIQYLLDARKDSVSPKKAKPVCIFCLAARKTPSADTLVLHKSTLSYVIMNKYPYANGHLMVIPRRHVCELAKLTTAEHAELGRLLAISVEALKKYARCDGFNLGMNLGEAAGAGIKDHLHYHVVPRWKGDHNFMPVLADVRVIPEHMLESYRKLRTLFEKLI